MWFFSYTQIRSRRSGGDPEVLRGHTVTDEHPLLLVWRWNEAGQVSGTRTVVDSYRPIDGLERADFDRAGIDIRQLQSMAVAQI